MVAPIEVERYRKAKMDTKNFFIPVYETIRELTGEITFLDDKCQYKVLTIFLYFLKEAKGALAPVSKGNDVAIVPSNFIFTTMK